MDALPAVYHRVIPLATSEMTQNKLLLLNKFSISQVKRSISGQRIEFLIKRF